MMKSVVMEDNKQGLQIKPIKKKIEKSKRSNRIVYKNRKDCIMKKTMELSILCGIKACTICFGPNGEVETWPDNQGEVRALINMYRESNNNGKLKKICKSCDDDDGLVEKVGEESGSLKSGDFKNLFVGLKDNWLDGLSTESLKNFLRELENRCEAITNRIEFLKTVNVEQNRAVLASNWTDMYEPLPTIPSVEYSYNPMVNFATPISSVAPIWGGNCFGDHMNCYGGGGGDSSDPLTFSDMLEGTNLNSLNEDYNYPVNFENNNNSQQVLASYRQVSPLEEVLYATRKI